MADTTKHWRFRYDGPRSPADDRECDMCCAVATGKNPKAKRPGTLGTPDKTNGTHSGPDGCPAEAIVRAKAAGKSAICPNHCGIEAALAAHAADHPEHDGAGFEAFAHLALEHVAALPPSAAHISVEGSGTFDPRHEDGTPDLSQPFSDFSMRVRAPRTEEQHEAHRQMAVAKLTPEQRKERGLVA